MRDECKTTDANPEMSHYNRSLIIELIQQITGDSNINPPVDSNLLSQGLDSIRIMTIAGKLRQQGISITFADLIETPTIQHWQYLLDEQSHSLAEEENNGEELQEDFPQHQECQDLSSVDPTRIEDEKTFELAPMQYAQWVGRDSDLDHSEVSAHLYVEFDSAPDTDGLAAHHWGRKTCPAVDEQKLNEAVIGLLSRHPMLRVIINNDGTQTIPHIDKLVKSPVKVNDLRKLSPQATREKLQEIRDRKSHQKLDISQGQVFDIELSLLPEDKSRLHVDLDMVACDALSYRILINDLARMYAGEQPAELTYSFQKFCQDEKISHRAIPEVGTPQYSRYERDKNWWQEQLPFLGPIPQLPTLIGQRHSTPVSRRLDYWLEPALYGDFARQCQEQGITPAMAVANIFSEAIRIWSGQSDFILNVPFFHRESSAPHPPSDLESIVGDFTSSLILNVTGATENNEPRTVLSSAEKIQKNFHNAAAHSSYSGLNVLRDLSKLQGQTVIAPVVFTSALNLGNLFSHEVENRLGTPEWILSQGPHVVLDSQITEVASGLLVNWDYRADLFPENMVEDMFEWFVGYIKKLIQQPQLWNAPWQYPECFHHAVTHIEPIGETLHEGFYARAEKTPEAVALVYDGGECISYATLAQQALHIAATLVAQGVKKNDRVGLFIPHTAHVVPALLGILSAGATYVPLTMGLPPSRLADSIEQSELSAVIVDSSLPLHESIRAHSEEGITPHDFLHQITTVSFPVIEFRVALEGTEKPLTTPVEVTREDPAYILFTSGSTGKPKGVILSHRAPMNTISGCIQHFGWTEKDSALCLSSLDCDWSVFDIFTMLTLGGKVLVADESTRRDPQRQAELIRTHEITYLGGMPSWLELLIDSHPHSLPSLQTVLAGGDRVSSHLAESFARLCAEPATFRFAGLGGATETAIHSAVCEVNDPMHVRSIWDNVPFGYPLPNMRVRIVHPEGFDCPQWVKGEYWVSGPGIAEGYLANPTVTAEKFVHYHDRTWYRSGDLLRRGENNCLEFMGRMDNRVKIRGYRVECGEVENALERSPLVHKAVVVVHEKPTPQLIALVDLHAQASPEKSNSIIAAIREHIQSIVPEYMMPSALYIVEKLPISAAGKLDRNKALQLVKEFYSHTHEVVEPAQTVTEKVMAQIWSEVLHKLCNDRNTEFISMGGDSVSAIAMVNRMRMWFDAPYISLSDILRHRTIAKIAQELHEADIRYQQSLGMEVNPNRISNVAEIAWEIMNMDEESLEKELETYDK